MGSDTLCVLCVAQMLVPAVKAVAVDLTTGDRDDISYRYRYADLVDAARGAVADGKRIDLDNLTGVGVYAATIYRGSAMCIPHVPFAQQEFRTGSAGWW